MTEDAPRGLRDDRPDASGEGKRDFLYGQEAKALALIGISLIPS